MNCRDFEDRLDAYFEGALSPEQHRELQNHIESCVACGRLLSVARGETESAAGDAPGLAESVLERTSGSPCVRARELLCDLVDGQLGAADSELVGRHLRHCAPCAALAAGLSELHIELPEMADIQPDPYFSAAVLRRLSVPADHTADRRARIRRGWANLLRRPRFSWEAAYVGTLLLVLAFGNPFSQSYGSPARGAVPAAAWTRASRQVPKIWEAFAGRAGQAAADVILEISGTFAGAEHYASAAWKEIAKVKASVFRTLEEALQRLSESIRTMAPAVRTAESRGAILRGELFLPRCVNADEGANQYGG